MSRGPQRAVIEAARALLKTRAGPGQGFATALEQLRTEVRRLDVWEWSKEKVRLRRLAAEQEARILEEALNHGLTKRREAELKESRASGEPSREP